MIDIATPCVYTVHSAGLAVEIAHADSSVPRSTP